MRGKLLRENSCLTAEKATDITCSHEATWGQLETVVGPWFISHASQHMALSQKIDTKGRKKTIPTTSPMRTCAQQHIGTKISAEGHTYFKCNKPNYFSRAGPSEQPHVAKLEYTMQPVSARESKGQLTGESN